MTRNAIGLTLGAVIALAGTGRLPAAVTATPEAAQIEFFEKKIRPVLVSSCYKCHAEDAEKIKGGLLLDTRDSLLKGGDSGPALVPGNPNKSLLIQTIRHDDPDLAMPPKGDKLADEVIADFVKWVAMGAPDPRIAKSAAKATAIDIAKARNEHWSFRPIARPEVPKVDDPREFVQTPVDAFVLKKLQEKGLPPSPPADKRALLRRATFDLTGLPPTVEEVEEFLAEDSPEAFAQVVDRLLASPRYGERWGRHWLDVARYADTSGDRQNGRRAHPLYPYAWTYRDYVVGAFNQDLPYDQFILQQIAADRLPEAENDKSSLAALGFLTVGKRFMGNQNEMIDDQIDAVTKGLMGLTVSCARCHDHKFDPVPTRDYYSLHGVFSSCQEPKEGPLLEDPAQDPEFKEFEKEVAKVEADVIEFQKVEAARLLAGMLEKTGDYLLVAHESTNTSDSKKKGNNFRLAAREHGVDAELAQIWLDTLKDARGKNDPVLGAWFRFAQLPEKQFSEKAPEVAAELAAAGGATVHPLVAKALAEKQPNSLKEVAGLYTDVFGHLREAMALKPYVNRRTGGKGVRFDVATTRVALADPAMESLRQQVFGEKSAVLPDIERIRRSLGNQYTNAENGIRAKIVTLQMAHPGSPARAMVLEDAAKARDSKVFIRGEPGNRGPVAPRQFLELIAGDDRKPFTDGSGRLELAQAIASRDNPLTARVIANRLWQWHFGQAIVRTVSDFGMRSEPPTHPELLDYLATYLMDNGWSLKKLHRLILLSGVYQQDSRLEQTAMQKDPTNQWLWRFNLQRLDFEQLRDSLLTFGGKLDLTMGGPSVALAESPAGGGRYGAMSSSAAKGNPNRRTVYGMIDRSALPEVFNTFDFANPDMSTGERILTTVPQQALFLMNSRFIVQQVRSVLARPEFESSATTEGKVRFLYRTLYQRPPDAEELKMAVAFIDSQPGEHSGPGVASVREVTGPAKGSEGDPQRKQMERGSRNEEPARQLNTWERYAQIVMLANEMVFVN